MRESLVEDDLNSSLASHSRKMLGDDIAHDAQRFVMVDLLTSDPSCGDSFKARAFNNGGVHRMAFRTVTPVYIKGVQYTEAVAEQSYWATVIGNLLALLVNSAWSSMGFET